MVDIVDYFDMMLMLNLQLMMLMNNLLFLIVKMIVVKGMVGDGSILE